MRAEGNEVSMARLCRWFGVPRSTFYYRPAPGAVRVPALDTALVATIRTIIEAEPAAGLRMITARIRRASPVPINRKKVHRILKINGWQVRQRPRGQRPRVAGWTSRTSEPNVPLHRLRSATGGKRSGVSISGLGGGTRRGVSRSVRSRARVLAFSSEAVVTWGSFRRCAENHTRIEIDLNRTIDFMGEKARVYAIFEEAWNLTAGGDLAADAAADRAEAACDAAFDALEDIVDEILQARATSAKDLAIKARVLALRDFGNGFHAEDVSRLCADVQTLAALLRQRRPLRPPVAEQRSQTMNDESHFDDVNWALDQAGITGSDRTLILTGAWTIDQIPKIENEGQARTYRDIETRLNTDWRAKGKDAFVEFTRSRVGILANAYGVRLLEWEDAEEDDDLDD
jgi:hypothetical protein